VLYLILHVFVLLNLNFAYTYYYLILLNSMISSKNIDVNINLNKFLKDFSSKKQYFKKVNDNVKTLSHLKQKGYRSLNKYLWSTTQNEAINEHVVMYIIDITFSRSNTFLHVMDSKGQLKFFASAGHFKYKGKNKKI